MTRTRVRATRSRARARAQVVELCIFGHAEVAMLAGEIHKLLSAQKSDFEINIAFFAPVILFDAGGARARVRARPRG